jgi:formate/nitrite transporter FocA (FNT family)
MDLPVVRSLSDLIGTRAKSTAMALALAAITAGLVLVSAGFLVAAAVVSLTQAIGFAASALVFGAGFAVLAVCVHLLRRSLLARREERSAAARTRVAADMALATALVRSTRPLVPFAAFIAAFAMGRRA